MIQLPIGKEDKFEGVIDLIAMKAYYYDGAKGEKVASKKFRPRGRRSKEARQTMLEALAMFSDEMMELLLGEEAVPEQMIHDVIRKATQAQEMSPVMMGSAFKNKGVQTLLDAVVRYLPSPLEREVKAKKWGSDEAFPLEPDPKKPFVGMAFKIVEDPYGQLTFTRIYQGTIRKGETYVNQRTTKKERFSRIVRMHADKRERNRRSSAGDIVAVMASTAPRAIPTPKSKSTARWKACSCPTGHQDVDRSGDARRRRQAHEGSATLHEGRSDLPRDHRRRDERNPDCGHG